jgi:hypothetical protein
MIGKVYRILFSPRIGTLHRCFPVVMRRSELVYFIKQLLIHELIRGSLTR